jgi:hypothetical protein
LMVTSCPEVTAPAGAVMVMSFPGWI